MELIQKHFEEIDSTNTWGKHHAEELPHDKITLVTASMQTAGRGRFNRKWVSPADENIYASFCFFIEKHRTDIGNIPQVLALSAAEALKTLGFNPELKWPNDILLSKKKVAGILAETTPLSDQLCMILGIGLNVNMPLETALQIDRPATSLAIERSQHFDVKMVLAGLQQQFVKDLNIFLEEGFQPFLFSYRKSITQSATQTIRFHDNRAVWSGTFEGINDDGSLRLKLPNGESKTFVAGEILWPTEF